MLLEAGGVACHVNESLTYSLPDEMREPVPLRLWEPDTESLFFSEVGLIAV